MSLESAIKSQSNEYRALRANLRARARDWVEQRTPNGATNARRQLNMAFDAGVSATIELLRDRDPLNLTEEEIETINALRSGEAGVVAINKRARLASERPDGASSDRTGRVRGADDAREGSGRVAPTVRETERERIDDDGPLIPCDIDGRELYLEARVVWTGEPKWGAATVKFLSQNGKRAKVLFDSRPDDLRQFPPYTLRMIDGSI